MQPLAHQQVHTFDLGEEERRCLFALDLAAKGESVALICSGDAGVYAMGALVYELANRSEDRAIQGVEIIANPGISAMFGAAARLGAPLGHPTFVAAHAQKRLEEESKLMQELPELPDLQCEWALLLLLRTAVPRANHLLRKLPPSQSEDYARGHDDLVRECLFLNT